MVETLNVEFCNLEFLLVIKWLLILRERGIVRGSLQFSAPPTDGKMYEGRITLLSTFLFDHKMAVFLSFANVVTT